MSRRVVIVQQGSDRLLGVADLLQERGYPVVVAGTREEAESLIADQCGAVLIENARLLAWGEDLCGWVRAEVRPVPAMVRLLADGQSPEDIGDTGNGFVTVAPGAPPPEIVDVVAQAARWWPGDD